MLDKKFEEKFGSVGNREKGKDAADSQIGTENHEDEKIDEKEKLEDDDEDEDEDEDEDDDEEEDEGEDEEEPGLDYLQKENLEVNTFLLVHESFTNRIFKGSFFQKGHICVSFQKYFDVCVKFNFLSK